MDILFSISDATGLSVTMINALLSSIILGLISGIIGSFIVLRQLSLMGDALSHAVLPGVALSYMFGVNMMVGATFFGLLASILIEFIIKKSKIKTDTSIGIILSTFFALGIILITKAHSGLDLNHVLFGNILAVTPQEIGTSAIILILVLVTVTLLYKELLITSFDPVMSKAYGLKNNFYHYLLMLLLTVFTVSALSQVGIVLVVALLITPAATAYLWSNKLLHMMIMASALGTISGIIGVLISFSYDLPTSAAIVLVGASFFTISFILSPKNGFLKRRKEEITI
ncbi:MULTISPECIES: metal ABC transporter permease [Carnobacterium]|jgi:iron/zinc/copper transport system substrate-binding protein/iron/zinc/copper transport system permease protein|uniref:Manganese import system permease protein ScaB n=1 Tax=Carnobacterium maltaromaticum TaxID=2751 RepID=A0AAW9JR89_CARML|nr:MULTISPECIES: metal ABC transporter permease [Carnobacterium]AOA03176.1 manganese ABC transporter substrate-binding protein [Carnobacterium maltaromaticum]KRN65295.1 manganese ABC transporter permease [Carnobacterium maltaromaticum DSM 20342]KRN72173.1 manganese ABC transporter permease [Carnobacterium maltaromaticum]KRN84090.1 manganese ABC transporter permease [Carnobacterium maltaromaticum]MBC9808840.1 iron chelate uptake ABC transporter family permease subunit [Carnobacterium maltaromat